jgi:hypothetical protein
MAFIPTLAHDLNDPDFRAITTSKQISALGLYANGLVQDKTQWEQWFQGIKPRDKKEIDGTRVADLLINAWNTERLLHITKEQFSGSRDGWIAQWAFPQAYYAAFNSTLAFFECAGHPEASHAAVRKKIGTLASSSKLGPGFNVFADRGKTEVSVDGITSNCTDFISSSLNSSDPENIKRHIISNLENTRIVFLKEQNEKNPVKNTKGEHKKRLSAKEWTAISDRIGKTSWLCILYRKRIKSNYRDIDTFLSEDLDLSSILEGLCSFISAYCLMCEVYVSKQLGLSIHEDKLGMLNFIQQERYEKIKVIL